MIERPILFSTPMVQALLRPKCPKTQTRRVVKPRLDPKTHSPWLSPDGMWRWMTGVVSYSDDERRCPYGAPGDRLWVREAWFSDSFHLRGDGKKVPIVHYRAEPGDDALPVKWKPSIHLPRAYARITLEITGVRLERLQAITMPDAAAEGFTGDQRGSSTDHFHEAWDARNGTREDCDWESNPWVWVVEFRRLTP